MRSANEGTRGERRPDCRARVCGSSSKSLAGAAEGRASDRQIESKRGAGKQGITRRWMREWMSPLALSSVREESHVVESSRREDVSSFSLALASPRVPVLRQTARLQEWKRRCRTLRQPVTGGCSSVSCSCSPASPAAATASTSRLSLVCLPSLFLPSFPLWIPFLSLSVPLASNIVDLCFA